MIDRDHNLYVIAEASQVAYNGGKVVVGSLDEDFPRAIEALGSIAARRLAQAYAAQQGVADPRIGSLAVRAYPVNSAGDRLDKVAEDVPAQSPLRQPAAYRADITIVARPY